MKTRLALALCVVLSLAGCFGPHRSTVVLRVLASSELADMQPVLEDLRADTGVQLELDLHGTVDATNSLTPGDYHHDLAWLATDRYFQLKLHAMNYTGSAPLTTSIMASPVVLGMKPAVAKALRDAARDHQVSWADVAAAAGAGSLRFGMADPR